MTTPRIVPITLLFVTSVGTSVNSVISGTAFQAGDWGRGFFALAVAGVLGGVWGWTLNEIREGEFKRLS